MGDVCEKPILDGNERDEENFRLRRIGRVYSSSPCYEQSGGTDQCLGDELTPRGLQENRGRNFIDDQFAVEKSDFLNTLRS